MAVYEKKTNGNDEENNHTDNNTGNGCSGETGTLVLGLAGFLGGIGNGDGLVCKDGTR